MSISDKWERRAYILWIVVSIWRIAFVFLSPLDLAPDEAYYWEWSRRPDIGYLSKPPLVSWTIWLFTSIFGHSEWSIRLPAALLISLSQLFVYLTAKRFYNEKIGFYASLIFSLNPGSCIMGYIMTIDPLLMFFWTLSLYTFYLAMEKRSIKYWIPFIISLGGGLLSKQTMSSFLILAPIFVLIREGLSKRSFFSLLSIWVSILFLIPPLIWNIKNGFPTLYHTLHHFEGSTQGFSLYLRYFLNLLGAEALIISPLIFILILYISVTSIIRFRDLKIQEKYLVIFGPFPLLGVILLSLKQNVYPNWPAPFFVSCIILLTASGIGKDVKRFFYTSVIISVAFSIFTYSLPFILPYTPLDGTYKDPLRRVKGWKATGIFTQNIIDETFHGDSPFIIVSNSRQITSELAFYLSGRPEVYHFPPPKLCGPSQYEYWNPPPVSIHPDALIIIDKKSSISQRLRESFYEIRCLRYLDAPVGRRGIRTFKIFWGRYLKCWPDLYKDS